MSEQSYYISEFKILVMIYNIWTFQEKNIYWKIYRKDEDSTLQYKALF